MVLSDSDEHDNDWSELHPALSIDEPHENDQAGAAEPFRPGYVFATSLPILRRDSIKQYPPIVVERSSEQLAALPFHEWLDHFLRSPANAHKLKSFFFSDKQYWDLLFMCMSHAEPDKVSDTIPFRDKPECQWLCNQMKHSTYRVVKVKHTRARGAADAHVYVALVTFKEVARGGKRGETLGRRAPTSAAPLLVGAMRRCIPYSLIEAALELCHRGPRSSNIHTGQDLTWQNCLRRFDGITRDMCRNYVQRCEVCQERKARLSKPPPPAPSSDIPPQVSTNGEDRFVRVEIGVINYCHQPCAGFKYLWYAQCKFTNYVWTELMEEYTAAEVAVRLDRLMSMTGSIRILQANDAEAEEYQGAVVDKCRQWGIRPPIDIAPYYRVHSGAERAGVLLERVFAAYQKQEKAINWATAFSRLTYQLNCTARSSSSTKLTPFEMVSPLAQMRLSALVDKLHQDTITALVNGERQAMEEDEEVESVEAAAAAEPRIEEVCNSPASEPIRPEEQFGMDEEQPGLQLAPAALAGKAESLSAAAVLDAQALLDSLSLTIEAAVKAAAVLEQHIAAAARNTPPSTASNGG